MEDLQGVYRNQLGLVVAGSAVQATSRHVDTTTEARLQTPIQSDTGITATVRVLATRDAHSNGRGTLDS